MTEKMYITLWHRCVQLVDIIARFIIDRVDWPIFFSMTGVIIFAFAVRLTVIISMRKNNKIKCENGRTGAEIAREILDSHGLTNVRIRWTLGRYNDKYIHWRRMIKLSRRVYYGKTVTAAAIAAHECGHAVQHSENYKPLKLRSALSPMVSIFSKFSSFTIFVGTVISFFLFEGRYVILAGLILFGVCTAFHLVTLPCEINASRRAMKTMRSGGEYTEAELAGAKRVLAAATLTYLSALAFSIIQLARLMRIFKRY